MNQEGSNKPRVDWGITISGLVIVLGLCAMFLLFNMQSSTLLDRVFNGLTGTLGGVFHIYVFFILILVIMICVSPIGAIRFGEGKAQYSTFSWISMLFCACIGSSILYWGLIEWAYYMSAPPFHFSPLSREAAEISVSYALFHWGISGWATYSIAAVIIAYYHFTKKIPNLRISVSCGFADQKNSRMLAKIIDIFVIVGLVAGVAVSIALGTPLIAAGLHHLFGIDPGIFTNILIAGFWACLFGASAVSGIDRGIKVLSNINTVIALVLVLFIFFAGNTSFIANNAVNSLGLMLQNYMYMSFYTDPIGKSGFPQAWTIFYWTWWVSYIPVMGLFIAKISRGRSVREVLLGGTLLGSLGCWLFLSILGGYGLDLQLTGVADTVRTLNEQGDYPAIIALLDTLPFAKPVMACFVLLAFIFLATTCDSCAYILASISTRDITDSMTPTKKLRLLWTVALIIWPIVLMIVGGLNVVKLSTVLGSIPILFILSAMIWNFLRDVRKKL